MTREAYSHEVSSCGFWPGGGPIPYPAFYSYAYPEPAGFAEAPIKPAAAFYSTDFREFILPYETVRQAASPDETLLDFLQTTYEAAAELGKWDRAAIERTAIQFTRSSNPLLFKIGAGLRRVSVSEAHCTGCLRVGQPIAHPCEPRFIRLLL